MGRIEQKFAELKKKNEKAFIAYITAGDPDLDHTEAIIKTLETSGVDILEVGVPFSDPTADGPAIQAAAQRALKSGVTLNAILDRIAVLRQYTQIPIVLFGYYNPIFSYGNEHFAQRAKEAGVDGILVVDLPPEEGAELRQYTDSAGLDFIALIAPTTGAKRIKSIARDATGFIYYISVTGVTGSATPEPSDIAKDIALIRQETTLPIAVGFGISTPEQAAAIAPLADGIVIGSAVVRLIEEHGQKADLIPIVSAYATEIKKAIGTP
ncbi:MAG: Tryptophan synthase alpha chain [Syntrophus sp. SKADARSKE-3]|nr:Tryptophan synthase alpha chain [Syntrophus sp. SKADARSKE-3]